MYYPHLSHNKRIFSTYYNDGATTTATGTQGTQGTGTQGTQTNNGNNNNNNNNGNGNGDDDDRPRFTKKQLLEEVEKEKKTYQAQIQQQVQQLEDLKKQSNLTSKQRDELQTRIDELNNSMLSKEELAKQEKAKLEKTYKEQLDMTSKERDEWKTRYTDSTIRRSIFDAAKANKAFSEEQIVDLLVNKTRLVEELDADGKPTGVLIPTVKLSINDKDGKPVNVDLNVSEAVAKMKDMPDRYGNLFESTAAGGIGGDRTSRKSSGPINVAGLSPEEYRKRRDEIKSAY